MRGVNQYSYARQRGEFWDKALIMRNGQIAAVRERKEIEQSGEDLEKIIL